MVKILPDMMAICFANVQVKKNPRPDRDECTNNKSKITYAGSGGKNCNRYAHTGNMAAEYNTPNSVFLEHFLSPFDMFFFKKDKSADLINYNLPPFTRNI